MIVHRKTKTSRTEMLATAAMERCYDFFQVSGGPVMAAMGAVLCSIAARSALFAAILREEPWRFG